MGSRKIRSGGGGKVMPGTELPDSRPFVAGEGAFEPREFDILELHLGGVRIGDLPMPEHALTAIAYHQTDEGMAELVERAKARGTWAEGSVTVVRDEADTLPEVRPRDLEAGRGYLADPDRNNPEQRIAERRAFRERNAEPWAEPNIFQEAVADARLEGLIGTGDAVRFLSPAVIAARGKRGWEIVKDAKGDPVKVGEMVLGRMPKAERLKRNRHFSALAAAAVGQMNEQIEEQRRELRGLPAPAFATQYDGELQGLQEDTPEGLEKFFPAEQE